MRSSAWVTMIHLYISWCWVAFFCCEPNPGVHWDLLVDKLARTYSHANQFGVVVHRKYKRMYLYTSSQYSIQWCIEWCYRNRWNKTINKAIAWNSYIHDDDVDNALNIDRNMCWDTMFWQQRHPPANNFSGIQTMFSYNSALMSSNLSNWKMPCSISQQFDKSNQENINKKNVVDVHFLYITESLTCESDINRFMFITERSEVSTHIYIYIYIIIMKKDELCTNRSEVFAASKSITNDRRSCARARVCVRVFVARNEMGEHLTNK